MKPAAITTIIFLVLVSIAQLTRFSLQVEVKAGGVIIPVWLSFVAFLFTGGLAFWLWWESRKQ